MRTAPKARVARAGGDRVQSALEIAALLSSVFGLLVFARTLGLRLSFVWPLEWMEGESVQHALRLLRGQALYVAPSADFVPYLYPPLAYAPMAMSLALFGASLPAARIASLACTFGSLALLGRIAWREAGPRAGIFAAGLFAIGFGYGGAFLDLARVDACFVLLLLAGTERLQAGRPHAALGWLALSAFAKQHGLLLLAAASVALLLSAPRRHARAVIATWLAVFGAFAALQVASFGWFFRYVLSLPSSQPLSWSLLLSFVPIDLFVYLPVLAGVAAYDAYLRFAARKLVPFDALLLAAIVAGALGRAHAGGHDNVRLPAFALLCIAGVVPLWRALQSPAHRLRTRALSCLALTLQVAMLWQAPSLHAPPRASAAQFAALRAGLDRCAAGGTTAALDYARLGSQAMMHTMALSDLRMSGDDALADRATHVLLAALQSPHAPRALAVGERFPGLTRVLAAHYRECARLPAPELASGYRPGLQVDSLRLQIIYTRADVRP